MIQPALVIVLLVLPIGVFLRLRHTKAFAKNRCRWQRDLKATTILAAWECQNCGEQAFSGDGEPPTECKRLLREYQ
ncbi:MAG: hypothetical protein ACU0C9_01050 [Paracoccaceae bacterium]